LLVTVCLVGLADTAKCADWVSVPLSRRDGELVRHIICWSAFSSAVGATERLVLFPTLLLLDLLGAGNVEHSWVRTLYLFSCMWLSVKLGFVQAASGSIYKSNLVASQGKTFLNEMKYYYLVIVKRTDRIFGV